MEAYVWACTDEDTGVSTSTRVFGSAKDAVDDAQECIGDACPVHWSAPSWGGAPIPAHELEDVAAREGLIGTWRNPGTPEEESDGTVVVNSVKVRL